MKKIILASTSPRRREILEAAGISFFLEESGYEEDLEARLEPEKLAEKFALGKAEAVAKRHLGEDVLVIGADTIVAVDGVALGKPGTKERAREMLSRLGGKAHSVITAFAVVDARTGKKISRVEKAKVYFRRLGAAEIDAYVETGEPLDKAGAYAIQGGAAPFIERIEGGKDTVIGLPLAALLSALQKFGA